MTFLLSNFTSSQSVREMPWTMLPSMHFSRPSGLMIWPQSWPTVNFFAQILPVVRSTSTYAITATLVPFRWA